MKKLNLTIGSDPELVIVDMKDRPASALRVLKNDKRNPIDLGDGVRFYADNVLAELAFNPAPPEKAAACIVDAIQRAKSSLKDYKLVSQAATMFPAKEVRSKAAKAIGCMPNFDAYKWEPNPKGEFISNLRTGSFHLHIGNAEFETGEDTRLLTKDSRQKALKLLDLYLGVTSVLWDKDPTSILRRSLYGRAGEFRQTEYGIEYRVLGNYALRSATLISMVVDLAVSAMRHIEDETADDVLSMFNETETIRAINEGNHGHAAFVAGKLALTPALLAGIFHPPECPSTEALSAP